MNDDQVNDVEVEKLLTLLRADKTGQFWRKTVVSRFFCGRCSTLVAELMGTPLSGVLVTRRDLLTRDHSALADVWEQHVRSASAVYDDEARAIEFATQMEQKGTIGEAARRLRRTRGEHSWHWVDETHSNDEIVELPCKCARSWAFTPEHIRALGENPRVTLK